jgi:transaldolase
MKIFLEITFIQEIREVARWGILGGITTNPTLLSKTAGKSSEESICEIAEIVNGDMSAKTVSWDTSGMLEEARRSAAWHFNVVAKVPFTPNGWAAIKQLKQEASAPNTR